MSEKYCYKQQAHLGLQQKQRVGGHRYAVTRLVPISVPPYHKSKTHSEYY